MTGVAAYLRELESALRVRGRLRRRFLAECREHLADTSAALGEEEAVRRFGAAVDLARAVYAEAAVRRGLLATVMSAVGVLAVAGSTLVTVRAADPTASAVLVWAVVFFASAQTSAVAAFLALVQAAAMRYSAATPADVVLLCRRNLAALGFALMTLFAAGAAVPGQAPAWKLLVGPAVAAVAVVGVLRARLLAGAVDPDASWETRSPLGDVLTLVRRSGVAGSPCRLRRAAGPDRGGRERRSFLLGPSRPRHLRHLDDRGGDRGRAGAGWIRRPRPRARPALRMASHAPYGLTTGLPWRP